MGIHAASGLVAVLLVAVPPTLSAQLPSDVRAAREVLLEAEDARASTPTQLAALVAGLSHVDVMVRLQAVRAVGRLEDPSHVALMARTLDDASLEVRIEAAHAIAQCAVTSAAATDAFRLLYARLAVESDGGVRGAIATSIGRLPYDTANGRTDAMMALLRLISPEVSPPARPSVFTLTGVARGAASLARGCARQDMRCDALVPLLETLFEMGREKTPSAVAPVIARRVRRLAASGLASLDAVSPTVRDAIATDVDPEVRRIGVIALASASSTPEDVALGWLTDVSPLVRHAAVQRAGERWPSVAARAMADASMHVRLAAIDALGVARACSTVVPSPFVPSSFVPSSFLPLCAAVVTDAARSAIWQTRMYGARAAGAAGQVDVLRELARDMHPNVREAALAGLAALSHRDSDDVRIEALTSGDYQLVLTAARTLEGTPRRAEAQAALLAALTRVTGERRDTSRDTRLALIDRIDEVGDAAVADTMRPWLGDADRVVAERVGRLVEARTGQRTSLPPVAAAVREPLPSPDDIARLETQQVVLSLRGHGDVVIRLAAREAPMNVTRFARQVAAGDWNGLTFHRVEPGFVVQGGSPGANEYVGADRYTRDERSHLSHVRGSVGISTRGRDTGDGQIFINLVDNPRLDHTYTVIGSVSSGMAYVDALLEGAVIERARLIGP